MAVAATAVGSFRAPPASAYIRPGTTERVSLRSDGSESSKLPADLTGGCAGTMDVTPNGRFVAFDSNALNLIPGDTNLACDVYVYDRKKDRIERVSKSTKGIEGTINDALQGFPASVDPSISANGRYVAFTSYAENLVPNDTNNAQDVFVHDRHTRRTIRVSVNDDGSQTHREDGAPLSETPAISANGRYVAFLSWGEYLIEGEQGAGIYRRDLKAKKTVGVSYDANGDLLNAAWPSINANGRYVVWSTSVDVFVRDMEKNETILASETIGGTPSAGVPPRLCICDSNLWSTGGRQISADGRYVTFMSTAADLVPNDTNEYPDQGFRPSAPDVFVRDLKEKRTERISVDAYGRQSAHGAWMGPSVASAYAYAGAFSPEGRFVAFSSAANDLVQKPPAEDATSGMQCISGNCIPIPGTNEFISDAYVHDRHTGELTWISATPEGRVSNGTCTLVSPYFLGTFRGSWAGALGDQGRFDVFSSCGEQHVEEDRNQALDVFVHDRGTPLGTGRGGSPPTAEPDEDLCVAGYCVPEVCLEETCIPPSDYLSERDPGDVRLGTPLDRGAELIRVTASYRPTLKDLYFREDVEHMTILPGPHSVGGRHLLYGLRFEVDGQRFEVRAAPSGRFGLFDCSGLGCVELERLRGGYGTTGHQVTVSVPLRAVGLSEGGTLSEVQAFSALGTYLSGPVRTLDTVTLR